MPSVPASASLTASLIAAGLRSSRFEAIGESFGRHDLAVIVPRSYHRSEGIRSAGKAQASGTSFSKKSHQKCCTRLPDYKRRFIIILGSAVRTRPSLPSYLSPNTLQTLGFQKPMSRFPGGKAPGQTSLYQICTKDSKIWAVGILHPTLPEYGFLHLDT